ncbi:hypothetical protein ABHF33_09115 [Chitinibacter sp. FCG-7]|uniref:Uncharacterized protein n=1 Tax=Chitinibacter mangrovi TaxID=3153927 RepID=A0AAU7F3K7_9NEIS
MRTYLALLFLVNVSISHAATQEWEGVWRGQIGDESITTCFQVDEYHVRGLAYSATTLDPISLDLQDELPQAVSSWQTYDDQYWDKLTVSADDELLGTWRHKENSLAIRLKKVVADGERNAACWSDAFHSGLERNSGIKTRVAHLDQLPYLIVSIDVEPADEANEIKQVIVGEHPWQIPSLTAEVVAQMKALQREQSDCFRNTLINLGRKGDLYQTQSLPLLTQHWYVLASHSGGYCGGASMNYSKRYQTFQRGQSQPVNVWHWLNHLAIDTTDENTLVLTEALHHLLVTQLSEQECNQTANTQYNWHVFPSAEGLTFSPSISHPLCDEWITLSYAKIAKFLSPAGKEAMKRIQADLKRSQGKRRIHGNVSSRKSIRN